MGTTGRIDRWSLQFVAKTAAVSFTICSFQKTCCPKCSRIIGHVSDIDLRFFRGIPSGNLAGWTSQHGCRWLTYWETRHGFQPSGDLSDYWRPVVARGPTTCTRRGQWSRAERAAPVERFQPKWAMYSDQLMVTLLVTNSLTLPVIWVIKFLVGDPILVGSVLVSRGVIYG